MISNMNAFLIYELDTFILSYDDMDVGNKRPWIVLDTLREETRHPCIGSMKANGISYSFIIREFPIECQYDF